MGLGSALSGLLHNPPKDADEILLRQTALKRMIRDQKSLTQFSSAAARVITLLKGIEINETACKTLSSIISTSNVINKSIFERLNLKEKDEFGSYKFPFLLGL